MQHGFKMGQKLESAAPIDVVITDWINLGIASLLVMGAPNVILNMILMSKEAQFYLFTVSNEFVYLESDDLGEAVQLFISMLNPLFWVEAVYH